MNVTLPMEQIHELCRKYHVRELAVFGSVLRDDFTPESDVDFLVDFQADARIGLLELAGLQEELAELIHRPVDIVPKGGLKPLIRDNVLSDARVIYAAA